PPKSSGSLDDALVQCVKDVRHALSDETHRLIKTVPRRGYLFTLEPTRDSSTSYAPTRSDQHIEFCRAKDGVKLAMASIGQGLPLVRLPTWFNHLEYDWHVQFRTYFPHVEDPIWREFLPTVAAERRLPGRRAGRELGAVDP